MSISPIGKSPPLSGLKPKQNRVEPRGSRLVEPQGSRLDDEERASRAAREAQSKIEDSEKRVRDAEVEANTRIEHLRDDSEHQVEAESIRQEASIEGERNKGYATLRELKQAQQAELNRVRREGERELAQARSYYRDTIYNTEKQGKEDLTRLQTEQENREANAQRTHLAEMDDQKSAHAFENDRLHAEQEQKFHELERSSREEYERYRQNTDDAKKKANLEFQAKYASLKADHDATLSSLESHSTADLSRARMDTAAKLAAYSSRQDDSFYKMIDIDARMRDSGDAFVLRATIPEHERDHLSVAVRGNQVVLSGARRNEETLDLGPGRQKTTNSYQAYHETFGLDWPVDTHAMTKTFDGDELVVTIPKKGVGSEPIKREAAKPSIARLERPKFPGNLPISKYQEAEQAKADLSLPESEKPKKGARTLA